MNISPRVVRKSLPGPVRPSEGDTELVNMFAPIQITVMILGESGTGKEHIARMIHEKSKRANKPFVTLDCGTLNEQLAASTLLGHEKGALPGQTMPVWACLRKRREEPVSGRDRQPIFGGAEDAAASGAGTAIQTSWRNKGH